MSKEKQPKLHSKYFKYKNNPRIKIEKEIPVMAIIRKFAGERNGGYIVTHPYPFCGFDRPGSTKEHPRTYPITFEITAWRGKNPPRRSQVVELYGIQKFSFGWSARRALPVIYSGEDGKSFEF